MVLISCCWICGASSTAVAAEATAYLVWGERDIHQKYRIHFSRYAGRNWSSPLLLSDGQNEEILPTVGSDTHNTIWVAWSELRGVRGVIRYRVSSGEVWNEAEYLETRTISDLAPSIAVDAAGVTWMVYSGSDGTQDDIFAVRWLGDRWSSPEMVHPGNGAPDILPRISIHTDGHPVVSWQGFTGSRYQTLCSQWIDGAWSAPQAAASHHHCIDPEGASARRDAPGGQILRNPPSFLRDTSQAVLHLKSEPAVNVYLGRE